MVKKKKKAVWLITGGAMQRPAAERIKARGFTLLLSDGSDHCAIRDLADEFLHIDIFDIKKNIEAARELRKRYDIRAVFTAGSDCHETVAQVARFLHLPGIDPRIAHMCRYKHLGREKLREAGVPQPRSGTARTWGEAQRIAKKFGYPVCLKATNNAGSRGFSAIHSSTDLTEEAFLRAQANGTSQLVIVEELLEPVTDQIAEQSVETLWYDGQMYWLNWVDRMFREDMKLFPGFRRGVYKHLPWAVEIGHLNPAVHESSIVRQVQEMCERAGRALGLHKQKGGHILKHDIMLTKKGPYILESTPRLSGGWDSSGSTIMRGADFIDGALEMALGTPLTPELFYRYFVYKYPQTYVGMMSEIPKNAKDCIGRRFALATGTSPDEAVAHAFDKVVARRFIV